jgi:hypothetical protein
LTQRFGSAHDATISFRMLKLDGADFQGADVLSARLQRTRPPTIAELTQLTQALARISGHFSATPAFFGSRCKNSYLSGDAREAGPRDQL